MKIISSCFAITALVVLMTCSVNQINFSRSTSGPETSAIPLENYQKFLYVSRTIGSDQKSDGSKDHPWQSLQFPLSQINDARPDKRYAILVAEGIYTDETLQMKEYVDLFGGFEPSTWQRDIFRHRTVLSGEDSHRVINGANHARLDGFFITKGQIRGKGAGVFCEGVSPMLTNNIFALNKTLAPIPWNPKFLHETANDGGAIYCENGASPIIENNLFAKNATENGRGAAIAFHHHCNGRVANNVFLDNTTGLNDPMRSSDGGAIAIFDWSSPTIENNIILNNQSLASNDAGGLFVALWSSPTIRKNIFVGNRCDDDAGALFVGGQEHRYDRPLDPLPGEEKFFVRIDSNIFIGNSNPSKNSGAMRFTMESRGVFSHNIVAHNSGIYFQRSEVTVENNMILDDFLFIETKDGLKAGVIQNNLIWANFSLETTATVKDNNLKHYRPGNFNSPPEFLNDWIELQALSVTYSSKQFVTNIFVSNANFKKNEMVNRIIKSGDKWGVIRTNDKQEIEIWGDFSGAVKFVILPTYQLK